jgi:hypothetical protein
MCGSWAKWIEEWKTFKKENPECPMLEIAYEDMKTVICIVVSQLLFAIT